MRATKPGVETASVKKRLYTIYLPPANQFARMANKQLGAGLVPEPVWRTSLNGHEGAQSSPHLRRVAMEAALHGMQNAGRSDPHCSAVGATLPVDKGIGIPAGLCRWSDVETETLRAWVSPSAVARVEGIVGRRQLPGTTNALEAAKANGLHQVNQAN